MSIGELSAARQALEGASVAPGTLRTLQELTNPEKRPAWPRSPIPPDIDGFEPEEQLDLSSEALFKNIRKARRGAAGGPSGMTVGQRHRRWRCVATPRCENNRSANCRSGGGGHCSFSICIEDQSRVIMCRPYFATPHRFGPPRHSCFRRWDRRVRPCVEKRDAPWTVEH